MSKGGGLSFDQIRELRKIDRSLEILQRSVHGNATTLRLRIFLAVAEEEGLSISDIARSARLSLNTVSNTIQILSTKEVRDEAGAGLLELREDPRDMRKKLCYLSQKGSFAIKKILEQLK